ncbi:ribonuclease H-like domain-containing protein [Haematococcus lacustris]
MQAAAQEPGTNEHDLSCTVGSKLVERDRSTESWASEPCTLGIDEAGRGPVLGPMVYACLYAPAALDLKTRAFADSKTLSAEKRDSLYEAILQESELGFCAEILSAAFISSNMLSRSKVSLNALATNSTVKIIQTVLDRGVKITQVFIDTVGDPERYRQQMERHFPNLDFTVCPKADALYPVVSAASIVAKVVRDRALERCKQDCGVAAGVKLGSGYPADPDTKAWLRTALHPVWGCAAPGLMRFSWETSSRLLAEEAHSLVFEADLDAGGGSAGSGGGGGGQQRLSFGASPGAASGNVPAPPCVETAAVGRHSFFRARKLQRLTQCF